MVKRTFWLKNIEKLWSEKSILWLSGVRRAGKTFLCKSIPRIEYFDCELPRVRTLLEDTEGFLEDKQGKQLILDEIHRLPNPSEFLKIAADHYPSVRIIATGSSTLSVSSKFKDTLTGRKRELWLTPMTFEDLKDFQKTNLKHRFLLGGLPPFFLSQNFPESYFQEWIDSYWAKDIQELFRLEQKYPFQKFIELLMVQSGGIFEANQFSKPCEVSRTTISNYLKVLEATYIAHIIRPFSSHKPSEIIAAPKVYMFDTGFICYYRGWYDLRPTDLGLLWEHFVLNELQAQLKHRSIYYWRDKRGHEIDFILISKKDHFPLAIETKWNSKEFDPLNIKIFLNHYPQGKAMVIAHDIIEPFQRKYGAISIKFINLSHLSALEKII